MFLPNLFVVASSVETITTVVWIVIALIVVFVKNAINTDKNKKKNPKPQKPTEQRKSNSHKHAFGTSQNPVESPFGQDQNAHSYQYQPVTVEEPEPINDISDNQQPTNQQIDLSSKDEIKKAVIYSEIFNRKY